MIRVLYAEDDPQIADLVQIYFSQYGHEMELAVVDSGRRCLAEMERVRYDILLLDLMMPDLDGLQVLGELTTRRDPTPVIMVSAHGQHELAVRALRAGAIDCIDKVSPDFRRIAEIARRVYEQRKHRQRVPPPPPPLAGHRVVFVDPDAAERHRIVGFFATGASRLHVIALGELPQEKINEDELGFDAVVLGPTLATVPMLNILRHLHARDEDLPVVVVSAIDNAATTIAAFKLGAHDVLMQKPGTLPELVFSLNNALKRADTERLNAKLTGELAALNQSLTQQVAARTHELEQEIIVRREAEQCAEEQAARLQALSSRLLRVQEDERRGLARELHDQLGQLLTGLRFQLEAARGAAPSKPLGDALEVTAELLRSVRALSLQLRPPLLDDLGLRPALEWQTKLFHDQTAITVDLELSLPAQRLTPELETTVFRMVQEALTNVARHSGATAASVTVIANAEALQVEISDRGCGFDAGTAMRKHDSLGLPGLAERVRLAGGQLDIFSQPGHGTRLHAEFPLVTAETILP